MVYRPSLSRHTPKPYYEEVDSEVLQEHSTTFLKTQYVAGIRVTNSWVVPAVGEDINIEVPDVVNIPIGAYLFNPLYGFFKIQYWNPQTRTIGVVNENIAGTVAPGTEVPAGVLFIPSAKPCCEDDVSSLFPYVATDFIAPAVNSSTTVTVTSTLGLRLGDVIQISTGLYRLLAVNSLQEIVIKNEGGGLAEGEEVEALDVAGDYQYLIIPRAVEQLTPTNGLEHVGDSGIGIANNAVTNARLADNAVTTTKIVDNQVATAKLTNSAVTAEKLADEAVTAAKLLDGAVTTTKLLALAVTTAKIANDAVSTDKLLAEAVTTAKIDDGAVTTNKLADGAVAIAKLADLSVTTAKIDDVAVTTAKILDLNVTTLKLANSAVTTAKIADSNVTTLKIADANVTTAKIADGNVTEAKLHDDAASRSTLLFSAVATYGGGAVVPTPMTYDSVFTSLTRHTMPKAGKVTHISVNLSTAVLTGSLEIAVYKNAVYVGQVTITSGDNYASIAGTFAAGDYLELVFSSPGATPTSISFRADAWGHFTE